MVLQRRVTGVVFYRNAICQVLSSKSNRQDAKSAKAIKKLATVFCLRSATFRLLILLGDLGVLAAKAVCHK
jgi:hypothetical protein